MALSLAIDKHGTSVAFLLTARRDPGAAKSFFLKMLQDQPLLSPERIGTDAAGPYPTAIREARKTGLLACTPPHSVIKHLQQRMERDHFRVKAHATSWRLLVLPHGKTDHPGLRGHAVAAQGVRLCRPMNRS